jgi:hypothetical protein
MTGRGRCERPGRGDGPISLPPEGAKADPRGDSRRQLAGIRREVAAVIAGRARAHPRSSQGIGEAARGVLADGRELAATRAAVLSRIEARSVEPGPGGDQVAGRLDVANPVPR